MSRSRPAILAALLLIAAAYSATSLADHPPYAVGILVGTESPVNRQVIALIVNKDYKQLQELVSKGININTPDNKGGRLIHFAAHMGSIEAVKIFANLGADRKQPPLAAGLRCTTRHSAAIARWRIF